jgi:hypothetical protein
MNIEENCFKMLKILVFIVVCIIFISCTIIPIKGNGILVTSEETVSAFEKIHIAGGRIDVYFYESQEYQVIVTVDSNLKEYLKIDTKNDFLNIETKKGRSYLFTKCLVEVYCPTLTVFSISGSGYFKCIDKIITSTFESKISGSGKIEGIFECNNFSSQISGSGEIDGTIDCDDFSVQISGSGKITVIGNNNNSNIHISGSGTFNGNNFNIKNATVNINGSGKMDIFVTDYLKANISGSGKINYRGDPKIDFSSSGSSKLNRL